MQDHKLFLIFLVAFALIPAVSIEAQVYKWVDETGRTHYSQQKPPQQNEAELMNIKTSPSSPSQSTTGNQRLKNMEAYMQVLDKEKAEREKREKEIAAKQLQRQREAEQQRLELEQRARAELPPVVRVHKRVKRRLDWEKKQLRDANPDR